MHKVTMTQGEVVQYLKDGRPNPKFPHDGQCKSGHCAPAGTRFFAVHGSCVPAHVAGVYCELCLAAANKRSEEMKREQHESY